MARVVNRLSSAKVRATTQVGLYADGGNLALRIGIRGSRSWVFRYTKHGRAHELGLGPLHTITLAEARQRATGLRQQLLDDVDPIAERTARRQAARLAAVKGITFAEAAGHYIRAHESAWANAKHRQNWQQSMEDHAYPIIGKLAVAQVDTGAIMRVLEPLWQAKAVTASKLRGRLEAVLDYSSARGWRSGPNPAAWKGSLSALLPRKSKVAAVKHLAAVDWREIGSFWAQLDQHNSVGKLPLKLAILTCARSAEVLGARWSEIDKQAGTWIIPASRMKSAREHRVPLSNEALAVLAEAESGRVGEWICPGTIPGRPLAETVMRRALKQMSRSDVTAHGMRSCFADWCSETGKPADLREAALAHALGSQTAVAYARGDLLARRRELMERWAEHCTAGADR